MKITRRKILISLGGLSIAGLIGYRELKSLLKEKKYPGHITGANFSRGHQLKEPSFPKVSETIKTETLIVGGGVSGLTAGYYLAKNNHNDFIL